MSDDLERLSNIRMPRFSWDYEDLSEAAHWFLMARAYLDCSVQLLSQMVNEKFNSSFHHAQVVVALFNHAVELFLKAGIVQAGHVFGHNHHLQELYNQFKNLYPGKKYEFEGDIVSAVRRSAATPNNQYARYPTDVFGRPWQEYTHIELVTWYKQLCLFVKDFDRLEPLLKQRYSQGSKKSEV